jgi:hypothetical protein
MKLILKLLHPDFHQDLGLPVCIFIAAVQRRKEQRKGKDVCPHHMAIEEYRRSSIYFYPRHWMGGE